MPVGEYRDLQEGHIELGLAAQLRRAAGFRKPEMVIADFTVIEKNPETPLLRPCTALHGCR
jgi:hypothetical protein